MRWVICAIVLISFCRCEITIIFVCSPRNNDKTMQNNEIEALIGAAKYFARYLSSFSPTIYRIFAAK